MIQETNSEPQKKEINLGDAFQVMEGKRADINPEFAKVIKRLFVMQDSTFVIVFGRRGTGKTALALLTVEILYNLGLVKHVATNTKIYDSPFPIKHIDNLEDLRYWAKTNYGRKIFIFDEIADAMSRRRPMAHLTVELIKQFNKLRKYKLSITGTTISKSVLDSAAMDHDLLDAVFDKPFFPKNHPLACKIAHYTNFLTGEELTIEDLPNTTVNFDSYDASPFTEKPKINPRKFKDEDMRLVYEWAQGKTGKALGLHPMQLNRKVRKILCHFFENQHSHVT